MNMIEITFRGATFDDFLERPQYGIVRGRGDKYIDISMPLTRNITLKTPIIGSNMDTVTREEMMKALSLQGCFGFLDRNCSIEEQVKRVKRVKRQHSYVIEKPLVISKFATIKEAKKIVKKRGRSGLLVIDKNGSRLLAGLLSNKDIPDDDYNLEWVSQFMTPFDKLIVSRPGISVEEAEKLMFDNRIEKLPLVDGHREVKGLITMKDLRLSKTHPYSTKDNKGRLLTGATIGAVGDYMERAEALIDAGTDCILIDIAHGHHVLMKEAVTEFRTKFKDFNLVCGNVATWEGAKFMMELGADAVKVGVGPGRGCRTRLEVGTGVPQLQAIREAYLAVEGKIPIIADGGIRYDGDMAKAILCGASTVMLGSRLAGTDEAPGVMIQDQTTKQWFKEYRGMTSPQAVLDGYRGEDDLDEVLERSQAAEGQETKVPHVGSLAKVIKSIRQHLQSAVSYAGEETLLNAHKKIAQDPLKYFERLTEASKKESFDR